MITYSKEDLVREIKRYDDKIHSDHMNKIKKTSIERWRLQYHCFMGHKFRLMNMIADLANET